VPAEMHAAQMQQDAVVHVYKTTKFLSLIVFTGGPLYCDVMSPLPESE